jgi:predicted dehydrogenase
MPPFPSALPPSRIPEPATAPTLRWGILAPGGIAGSFVTALAAHTRQRVVAVGSRSAERAAAFAARHGIERAHGSYAELAADPGVDVVYVASPHSGHREHALAAIAAGKHVLVEKSFTRNASEAAEVIEAARSAGVLAMEAMWARYLPQTDVIRQLLADGVLGQIATVLADHGQYFDLDPAHRLFNPDLAGGAMLDLGIYPVSFASFALGTPDSVTAIGSLTETGVDAQVSILLTVGAAQATLNTSLLAKTPTTASISGTAARVELSGPFYAPGVLTLTALDGTRLVRDPDPISGGGGLSYEAAELARCVTAGMTESPLLPLHETISVMRTLDEVRRQVGVVLPGE